MLWEVGHHVALRGEKGEEEEGGGEGERERKGGKERDRQRGNLPQSFSEDWLGHTQPPNTPSSHSTIFHTSQKIQLLETQ